MLVLSRRPDETIHIHTSDGIIKIHLNTCDHYQARLGFDAPKNVKILRAEIDFDESQKKAIDTNNSLQKPHTNSGGNLFRALFNRESTGRQTNSTD